MMENLEQRTEKLSNEDRRIRINREEDRRDMYKIIAGQVVGLTAGIATGIYSYINPEGCLFGKAPLINGVLIGIVAWGAGAMGTYLLLGRSPQ